MRGLDSVSGDYPNRPIRFIVPFAPKGPSDMVARLIGEKLTLSLGQPVIIDNQPGANGIRGTEIAAKAPCDGYTIVIATSAHFINPSIYRRLPFDAAHDFVPVSLVVSVANMLVVHSSVPARSLGELIEYAKARPGQLKYASTGDGGPPHLAGELFKMMAGIDIVHVPFKTHPAAGAAVAEGREAQMMFDAMSSAMSHVKAGELKAVGVTTAQRAPAMPDIPTIAEAGLPGYEANPAMGVLAPADTPRQIIDRLSKEIATIMHSPELKKRLEDDGIEAIGSTPEEFAAYMENAFKKWSKLVKDAGVPVVDLPTAA